MNNDKETVRKIDLEELKELSVVGGEDGDGVTPYSSKNHINYTYCLNNFNY